MNFSKTCILMLLMGTAGITPSNARGTAGITPSSATGATTMGKFYLAHACLNVILTKISPYAINYLNRSTEKDARSVSLFDPASLFSAGFKFIKTYGLLGVTWYQSPQLLNSHLFGFNSSGILTNCLSLIVRTFPLTRSFENSFDPSPKGLLTKILVAALCGAGSEFLLNNYALIGH